MRWLVITGALALGACEAGPAPSCEPSDVLPEETVWWCGGAPSESPPLAFGGTGSGWSVGCFAPDQYVRLVAADRGVIESRTSEGSPDCVRRSEWDGVTQAPCVIEDVMGAGAAVACGDVEYPPCPNGTTFRCLYPEVGLCEFRPAECER